MCSVQLMGDKIDLAFENGPDVIGVVSDSELDNNRGWATVQIVGRALIYRASGKHPSWRLMKKNAGVGPVARLGTLHYESGSLCGMACTSAGA